MKSDESAHPFSYLGAALDADPSVKHRAKTMTLSAEEFLRRFVEHMSPKGFAKVRHYGLLAGA